MIALGLNVIIEKTKGMKTVGDGIVSKPSSEALRSWLEDGGSFMRRLRERRLRPQVVVLDQKWCYPEPSEQVCVGVPQRRYVFVREVEIRHENQALMYARTVIPAATLTGRERILAHLGDRSLGSVLFSYPRFKRSDFEIQTCRLPQYSSSELWERQSLFYLREKAVFLREIFLPSLVSWIESL